MDNKQFILQKINLILIGVGVLLIAFGFILMSGVSSGDEVYNPEIFAPRYITVGPMISFSGFIFMIFGILYKPKQKEQDELD